MANIPAEELQKQANMQAPGQGINAQAKPDNLAQGRKQPGVKGGKGKDGKKVNAASSLYPNLPTQE